MMRLLALVAMIFGMIGAAGRAQAAEPCAGLPETRLNVYRVVSDRLAEHAVPRAEIERISPPSGSLDHPLMAIVDTVDSRIAVMHRVIAVPGGYCDAPTAVAVWFGVTQRDLYIAAEAAREPCVKATLGDHESEHNRAMNEALHRFIQDRQDDLVQRLAKFKGTAAPDATAAKVAYEDGLQAYLRTLHDTFMADYARPLKQSVDSPARLASLREACGGQVRLLEQVRQQRHAL